MEPKSQWSVKMDQYLKMDKVCGRQNVDFLANGKASGEYGYQQPAEVTTLFLHLSCKVFSKMLKLMIYNICAKGMNVGVFVGQKLTQLENI